MEWVIIGLLGFLSLLSVKVPEGTTPFVFYGVSTAVAFAIAGVIVLVLKTKSEEAVKWMVGLVLFAMLIAMAVSIVANLPGPSPNGQSSRLGRAGNGGDVSAECVD